eukprot:s6359_g3.t1
MRCHGAEELLEKIRSSALQHAASSEGAPVRIAVGCAWGKHRTGREPFRCRDQGLQLKRSVTMCEEAARSLRGARTPAGKKLYVRIIHREQDSWSKKCPGRRWREKALIHGRSPKAPMRSYAVPPAVSSRDPYLRAFLCCEATSMSAPAPSDADLAKKADELKKVTTKEGGDFDETPYKAAWDAAGADCGKVATALNLKDTPKDYADFINMCKAGKFKD